jgi:hypothetical protein
MTADDKARAMELMAYFGKYGGHLEGCSSRLSFGNPSSDYCDCGLGMARGRVRRARRPFEEAGGRQ